MVLNGLDAAPLLRGSGQVLVGGVHGRHEAANEGTLGRVLERGLAHREGRRGEGLDEVRDAGEDDRALRLIRISRFAREGVRQDRRVYCCPIWQRAGYKIDVADHG